MQGEIKIIWPSNVFRNKYLIIFINNVTLQLKWYHLFESAKHFEDCSEVSELSEHAHYWNELTGKWKTDFQS